MKTIHAYVIYTISDYQDALSITLNAKAAKDWCAEQNKEYGYQKYWFEPIIITENLTNFADEG